MKQTGNMAAGGVKILAFSREIRRIGRSVALVCLAMAGSAPGHSLIATLMIAQPAYAEAAPPQLVADPGPEALVDAMQLTPLFDILAEEGRDYGRSLAENMFPGRAGPRWQEVVEGLYDPRRIADDFARAFTLALKDQPGTVAAALEFYGSEQGQRIVSLELGARRSLLDPETTEAAEVEVVKARDARAPRLRQIRALIEAGDLIESNVAAGLSGAAAFSEGMAESAPLAQRLPEAERMEQVWREEAGIRATTTNWLLTWSLLAYQPLSDEEMRSYIRFLETPEGRQLSAALFAGFSEAFTPIMRDLGREAGLVLRGSEI